MKNIAVFGATGMTGLCVLKEALKQGYKVRALVRNPSKFPSEFKDKVDVVKGDVLNKENVRETLKGQDAVIVTLGTRNALGPTTVMSEGVKNIVSAMKETNITVISVCLSLFLFEDDSNIPSIHRNLLDDHRRMDDILKASGLNWIGVYAPYITNDKPTGYKIKYGGNTNSTVISKHDLAKFLVDSLKEPKHYQQAIGLSSK